MSTRIWGYTLLAVGVLLGFFRITSDPLPLTIISFSIAVAGVLLVASPRRLRWFVVLFLAPAATFGVLSIIFIDDRSFGSIAWIAVAAIPVWQVFSEARRQQPRLSGDSTEDDIHRPQ